MAATLTRELLDKLHKGNTSIQLLPVTGGKVTMTTLDFSDADMLYSLKDSFQISQDDPETEETKIDQGDAVIDTSVTPGTLNISGNYPTLAAAAFEYFFKTGKAVTSVTAKGGKTYEGKSFFTTPKDVEASILVQSADESTAIVFVRVKLTVSMKQDDSTQPFYLAVTGKVLTNLAEGEGDFAILAEKQLE